MNPERVIVTMYAGQCVNCKVDVQPSQGFAIKWPRKRWVACCPNTGCHKALGIEAEVAALKEKATAVEARKLTEEGEMHFSREFYMANKPLVSSIPGARWNPTKRVWTFSLKPQDRMRVLEIADKLGLDVPESLRQVQVSPRVEAAVERARPMARDYQLKGVQWLAGRTKALLADDMGLGKTFQTLMSIDSESGCIAIVPASVKFNWADEIEKFRPDLKATVLEGRKSFRWPEVGEVVIINFDILPAWLNPPVLRKATKIEKAKAKAKWKDMMDKAQHDHGNHTILVVDEAHNVKNYKAARTRKVTSLSSICAKTWFLTGTPLLNKPLDLWGILSAGNMQREVFGGWNKFTTLFNGHKNTWGGWEFGEVDPAVPERLRRVMLRRLKRDVTPELPHKTYTNIPVKLPKNMERDMDAMWQWYLDHYDSSDIPSFEEFSEIRAKLAKARTPAAEEIASQFEEQGTPLQVFSDHRHPVDTIGAREGWASITGDTEPLERRNIMRDFQAGKLKGIAATIKAAGVGLTLTHAAHALFVDLNWVPALNAQAEDRICRIGQTADKCNILRMVGRHALDQHILELLASKIALIDAAIESEVEVVHIERKGGEKIEIREETEEEYSARMAQIEEAARQVEREAIKAWVSDRLGKAGAAEVDVAPELHEDIKGAWSTMLRRCDGAQTEDGIGFNKPDAGLAHKIMPVLDTEEACKLAWIVLRKYKGQLAEEYPSLYA